ncbi:MAG TPA: ABC transporter substrate-binding protein [Methylomirabilota bacterium]|nr:ABC transporter substrate-binding protein [Methylomirabilota bacterium]
MKLRRLGLAMVLAASLLTVSFGGEAQQPKTISRIGFLASSSLQGEGMKRRLAAFQQGLRELGYMEGRNIVIEYRSAEGNFTRLPELAAELVRLQVDVIVAEGTPAAHAAKTATTVIPVVIGNAGDPVGSGLVASLARPSGNITGLSDFASGAAVKRLQLLREMVPSASRVAVLLNPSNSTNPLQLKEISDAAPAVDVTLLALAAKGPEDIDRAFTTIRRERPGGLIVLGDPMFGTHRRRIVEQAVKSRIPAIYGAEEWVDAGGLMGYGVNFPDLYRRASTYVDKILKGTKPAELPVEQPTKLELIINVKTARQLGLTIPQSILYRVDRVIQ